MGYTAQLQDTAGNCLSIDTPHHMSGCYSVEVNCTTGEVGNRYLELDFTSNYQRHFTRVLGVGGIKNIYGMKGADAGPVLEYAASRLKDNTNPDHWKPTQGNAKKVLIQLATMSRMRPDGTWWIHN